MCFNVFIICNHEKGTSIEIGSSEGGVCVFGGEGPWGLLVMTERGVCVCVFYCVPVNSFLVIIEIDVCCGAVNLQDLLLIKRQRQPSCYARK